MPNKRNTTGLVFDRMDTIGDYLVVFDPHVPVRHRHGIWDMVKRYQAEAQACAEMALCPDAGMGRNNFARRRL